MTKYSRMRHFSNFIETLLRGHPPSRKVFLDIKARRLIEDRFLIKVIEGSNHHAHICIIFDRKSCLSVGINSCQKHAEVDALKKLLSRQRSEPHRTHLGILIIRFSKTGKLNNSSPCLHCSQFLKKHAHYFQTISFSNTHGKLTVLPREKFIQHRFSHITGGHLCLKQ